MAHNTKVGRSYGLFELSVERWRTLDHGLKDLAVMAAAASIGCAWCMDFGYWEATMNHKVPAEKIRAVPGWRDSDVFTELERLVLEYAEAMTATPPSVTDELVERLERAPQRGGTGRAHRDRGRGEPAVADQLRAGPDRAGLQGPVRDTGPGGAAADGAAAGRAAGRVQGRAEAAWGDRRGGVRGPPRPHVRGGLPDAGHASRTPRTRSRTPGCAGRRRPARMSPTRGRTWPGSSPTRR